MNPPPSGSGDRDIVPPLAQLKVLKALQAEYGPALLAYTTRLLRDHQLAEDVVQETFVRAWRNADTLDLAPLLGRGAEGAARYTGETPRRTALGFAEFMADARRHRCTAGRGLHAAGHRDLRDGSAGRGRRAHRR